MTTGDFLTGLSAAMKSKSARWIFIAGIVAVALLILLIAA